MRNVFLAAVASLILFVGGCTCINPATQSLIDAQAQNAKQVSEVAQQDPDLKDDYKRWLKADARSWSALAAWARGERPTPGN